MKLKVCDHYNTMSRLCTDFETCGAYCNAQLNHELNEHNFIEETTVVTLIKVPACKISSASINLIRRLGVGVERASKCR